MGQMKRKARCFPIRLRGSQLCCCACLALAVSGWSSGPAAATDLLPPASVRLERMRWYDTDWSFTYSAGDRVELVFSASMSNSTVAVSNLIVMMKDPTGLNWMEAGVSPDLFFGTGHGAAVVSNSPVYAAADSHFFVTLGASPMANCTYAINPKGVVVSADGVSDATWPPVFFPEFWEGQDSDGDGMPDTWEDANGLDPLSPEGDCGWYGDPDRDGMINGYEYLLSQSYEPDTVSLLSPVAFDSDGDGIGDYDDRHAWDQLTYGESFDDADLLPDWWETAHQDPWRGATTLSPLLFSAFDDEDYDGWSNLDEFLYVGETNGVPAYGTDPSDPASHPEPRIAGRLFYGGVATGNYHVVAYRTPNMDGVPVAHAVVPGGGSMVDFELPGIYKGNVYVFAHKGGDVPDRTSPWGMPDRNPIDLGWAGVKGLVIGLNDAAERPYYPVFSWASKARTLRYRVTISDSAGVAVLTKWISAPRNWFMYNDYQTATYRAKNRFYGLPAGRYVYKVKADDGTVVANKRLTVKAPTAIAAPSPVQPVGAGVVTRTLVDFLVSNALPVAALDIRLTLPSGAVTNYAFVPPWRSREGLYCLRLPVLFGDGAFTNGVYRWDARAFNGARWTVYSAPKQTFLVDISAASRAVPTMGGQVVYWGRVPSNLVVEAFVTPDFAGTPVARYSEASPSARNGFVLQGLSHAAYYIRAYFDRNTNRVADAWESQGVARNPEYGEHFEYWDTYGIGEFDLTDRQFLSDAVIVIRDRDTDEDRMPDAWEMKYFGSLARDGRGDFDGDGLTDLQEYARGSDPASADSDGEGTPDNAETGL